MHVYTVHEPPEPPADRIDRAESLRFVGDGFTPLAVAFGPLWLVAKRLWVGLAIYAAACGAVAAIVAASGLGWSWMPLAISGFNLILGFEGASLERLSLERAGWRSLGTVSGRTLDECERRFLETYLANQRIAAAQAAEPSSGGIKLAELAGLSGAEGAEDAARGWRWLPWRAKAAST